ncbi:UNVERIFIED_CONTAM: hypothetical protein PYX00_007146 [Menopon gallinae]|uniref:CHK kinase-like domain-containing protein n=1 Tax=Menopon gallinae TaxID=328185 RepID=A0AAW2HHZ7_9NEOP
MKERGFVMADRKKGLDVEHCEAVLKALAKFHGLSLGMKALEPEKFFGEVANAVTECLFEPENEEWYHDYYTSATRNAVSFVRECLIAPEEREKYVGRFENFVDSSFFRRMVDLVKPKEPVAVLCHGDCWTNNILFKYSPSGDISYLCFLDFQLVRYGSPALDIVNFLYCCTSRKLRSLHMDHLIELYSEHLKKTLSRLGCSDDLFDEDLTFMPSLCYRMKEEIRKYGKFGLGLAIDMIPISTCDSDQAPDLYVTVQEEQKEGSENPVGNEMCKRRMTDLVQELVDNGEL